MGKKIKNFVRDIATFNFPKKILYPEKRMIDKVLKVFDPEVSLVKILIRFSSRSSEKIFNIKKITHK